MKRLILHIGQPKTGSTSLQYFLSANRLDLAKLGIAYASFRGSSLDWQNRLLHRAADLLSGIGVHTLPAAIGWESNHTNLAYEIGYSRDSSERFSPRRLTLAKLQEFVIGCREDTIIVSSESLLDFKRMRAQIIPFSHAIAAHGTDIEIACFLRPQHLLMNSFYAQLTKRLTNDLRFSRFCENYLNTRHRAAGIKLRAWSELPRSTIIALPFTRERLQPNIETVFFAGLGLEDRVSRLLGHTGSGIANPSPGPMTIEACRRAARAIGPDSIGKATGLPRKTRRDFSKHLNAAAERLGWNSIKFNGLDNTWRDRIRDAYADQNEDIAQRHWNRSWQDVFAADYDADFTPNEISRETADAQSNRLIDETIQNCARKAGVSLPARLD